MCRRLFGFLALVSLMALLGVFGLWVSSGWFDLWVVKRTYLDSPYTMHNGQVLGVISEPYFLFVRHSGGAFSFGKVNEEEDWFPSGGDAWTTTYYKWPEYDPALPPGWGAGDRPAAPIPPSYLELRQVSQATAGTARIPDWELSLLLLLLPVTWSITKAVRRSPVVNNSVMALKRCRKCGYDLRASPERCPECGTFAVR